MLKFKALFQLFQQLKGPIDRTDDRGGRYDQSEAWKELSAADGHWRDFVSLNPEYYSSALVLKTGKLPFPKLYANISFRLSYASRP